MAARSGGKFPLHSIKAPRPVCEQTVACSSGADSDEDSDEGSDEGSGESCNSQQGHAQCTATAKMLRRPLLDEESIGDTSCSYSNERGEEESARSPSAESEEEEGDGDEPDGDEPDGDEPRLCVCNPGSHHDVTRMLKAMEQSYKQEQAKTAQLTAKVDALESLNAAHKHEIQRLRIKAGEREDTDLPCSQGRKKAVAEEDDGERDSKRPRAQHGPVRSLAAATQDPNNLALALILPENLGSVAVPHSYKGTHFHFPHRVQAAKSGLRQYVVESRNLVYLACQLRNIAINRNATEMELPVKGDVCFKIEVFLASGGPALTPDDLRTPVVNLMNPPEHTMSSVKMSQGMVKWRFYCKFLSRATKPTPNQEFVLRVTCINPELAGFPISVETPPFTVVSREIKRATASV